MKLVKVSIILNSTLISEKKHKQNMHFQNVARCRLAPVFSDKIFYFFYTFLMTSAGRVVRVLE